MERGDHVFIAGGRWGGHLAKVVEVVGDIVRLTIDKSGFRGGPDAEYSTPLGNIEATPDACEPSCRVHN